MMLRIAALSVVLVFLRVSSARAADPAIAGKTEFAARCGTCHALAANQSGIGPSLAGVYGRQSGAASHFQYSSAMREAHLTWDAPTLARFLASPQGVVHGTKMFVSVPSEQAREDIVAYLKTLSH